MANILTISRMVFSLILPLSPAFSTSFAVIYLLAGLTDMLDGWVARRTGTISEAGARLDTVADIVFVIVCLIKILPVVVLPTYLWMWTAVIGAIKIVNVISGFVVQQKFVAVHSYLNKLTGVLLFLLPLTLNIVDIKYTGSVVCAIATLAAIQEGHRIRTKSKEDTHYGTERYKPMEQYMMVRTDEKLYHTLSQLTKDKSLWKENLPNVAALLKNHSPKLTAKAMWLLGEMGLRYPHEIASYVEEIAGFIQSENNLLRERAANALGRIGRADYELVMPYMDALLSLSRDEKPNVRLSFIWACENIATNTPEVFEEWVGIFEAMLNDRNEKVRMETPEIFRVIGKRKPELVRPYLEKLAYIAEHDPNRVVRIHAAGAIKAIEGA